MKTILMAAVAAVAATAFGGAAFAQDWQGFYVGASLGLADRSESGGERVSFDTNLDGTFGDTVRTAAGADAFSPGFCPGSFNTNAAGGGCSSDDKSDAEIALHAGYDFQFGSWVVGGLVEYSSLTLRDSVTAFSVTPAAYNFTRKLNEVIAFRARGGYAFGPNLVYATGGYAIGDVTHSFTTTNGVNTFTRRGGGNADGWQLGVGVEHKFTPNISAGLEFLRTSLKDDDYFVRAGPPAPATNPFILVNSSGTDFMRTDDDIEFNSWKVKASYRF